MAEENKENLPVSYKNQFGSLFASILNEFSTDISLYDQVMATYAQDEFEHLQKKSKLSFAGISVFDGGMIDGAVSMAGKGTSKDDMIAKKLSVAGQSTFLGIVAIENESKIAGSCRFIGNAIFGGMVKIAGKANFDSSVVVSGGLKISGRTTVSNFLLADSPIQIEGNLTAQTIRSTDQLTIDGRVFIHEDVLAKEIFLGKTSGTIQGSVYAEKISILPIGQQSEKNLSNAGGLIVYLKDTILGALKRSSRSRMIIEGDVFAEDVEIADTIIYGDLIIKNGVIGKDVEVQGNIYYENELQASEEIMINATKKSLAEYTNERKQLES